MLVYRYEHIELGVGPLCGETDFNWIRWIHDHASPNEDFAYVEFTKALTYPPFEYRHPDYFFAFNSLERMKAILKEGAEEALYKNDFMLYVYDLEEDYVVLEDGQVFFNKKKANLIDVL